jgi:hypothetical protein
MYHISIQNLKFWKSLVELHRRNYSSICPIHRSKFGKFDLSVGQSLSNTAKKSHAGMATISSSLKIVSLGDKNAFFEDAFHSRVLTP